MKSKLFFSIVLLTAVISTCFSQTYTGIQANTLVYDAEVVKFKNYSKVPNYFRFAANTTFSHEQTIAIVKSFITNANADLQFKTVQINGDSSQTIRYYQTVSGYPIEFTALNLQVKNGRVSEMNGEILDNPQITPNFILSEAEALQFALNFVNAERYMWQEDSAYFPQGEQVIVPNKINFDKSTLKSAYKFDIYSLKPHDRKKIYVDAETGEIILDLPSIHFSTVGKAQTAYYGERYINTGYNGSQYILHDSTRGGGIFTYNCHDRGYYMYATDYYNSDTLWGNTYKYATDAHFSTTKTYDYFWEKHGRNSIDGFGFPLISYVNFNLIEYGYYNNENAFWNGQFMTYGYGTPPNVTALTTMDICGHEITHGLTEFTAGLIYQNESGALNEAFSDIFGTAIEFYAVPEVANWTCGEKIGRIIRSLHNPKAHYNPNTYKGQYWESGSYDNGGVHINSGVLNYWFYLLCEGGSGTNDLGNSYNVTGMGISKAEQIAFKVLTQYLSPSSEYEDACFYGMQVAVSLFGACSDELKSVGDAFYAVGVLKQPFKNEAVADFSANITESCKSPITVQFSNKSFNSTSCTWDFGDGSPISSQLNPSHTYTTNGIYTVTLTVSENTCGNDTMIKQNYIHVSPDLPCNYFMTHGNQQIEGCHGFIYDDGGANNVHSSYVTSRLTIHSPGADSILLYFHEFNLEACTSVYCVCDYLSVYRGNSTSSLIGKYCNMNLPPQTITVKGEYATLYFSSDPLENLDGFKIEFICYSSNNPPVASFIADNTKSCQGIVNFTDNSVSVGTQINSWLWNFGDGQTSTLQNPTHQYYANGNYTVSLTVGNANGQQSLLKPNYIVVSKMEDLGNHTFKGDNNQAFNLYIPNASPNLKWYNNKSDNLSQTTPVFTGNPISHPAVSGNKTYYIIDSPENGTHRVGDTACSTRGSFFNSNAVHYLVFDAYQDFHLNSVLVNANSSGVRSIMLRDANQKVIWSKNVYIPIGKSRVVIDMEVPIGMNLQLACESYPNLFRSNNTAFLNYPYTIDNVVSIKKSSAGGNDDYNFYYYFYDWEINLPDCYSQLSTVSITSDNSIQDYVLNNVVIMPNPSSGIFRIENLSDIENRTITISEITGKILNNTHIVKGNILDLSTFATGVYFVRIDNRVFKVVKY